MSELSQTIRICASCTKINAGQEDLSAFHLSVKEELMKARPDLNWEIERSPCLKLCPIGRISMTVTTSQDPEQARLTMSREATVESVAKEILSFFRK
jgi:hypothetical protein